MDGDNRRTKHHDPTSRINRRAHRPTGSDHRFRHAHAHAQHSLQAQPDLSQATARPPPRIQPYPDYGYTDPAALQGGSLQPDELQPYAAAAPGTDFTRQNQQQQQQSLREQHRQRHQQQQQQHQQIPQQFNPYEPTDMVYHLNQPTGQTAQQAYEVVPQYPGPGARQSAAIEALSSQFGVPQYFPPTEPAGSTVQSVVSPYLTPQQLSSAYNQGPIGRSNAQPFPASMADFTPSVQQHQHQQQSPPQAQAQSHQPVGSESLNVSEAYGQFQQALRGTFGHARSGRLVEASRSLLEISEWLVSNARELGKLAPPLSLGRR